MRKMRRTSVTLGDGLVSVCVHLHGDAEVIKCIQELTELPELFKRNSLKMDRKFYIKSTAD